MIRFSRMAGKGKEKKKEKSETLKGSILKTLCTYTEYTEYTEYSIDVKVGFPVCCSNSNVK